MNVDWLDVPAVILVNVMRYLRAEGNHYDFNRDRRQYRYRHLMSNDYKYRDISRCSQTSQRFYRIIQSSALVWMNQRIYLHSNCANVMSAHIAAVMTCLVIEQLDDTVLDLLQHAHVLQDLTVGSSSYKPAQRLNRHSLAHLKRLRHIYIPLDDFHYFTPLLPQLESCCIDRCLSEQYVGLYEELKSKRLENERLTVSMEIDDATKSVEKKNDDDDDYDANHQLLKRDSGQLMYLESLAAASSSLIYLDLSESRISPFVVSLIPTFPSVQTLLLGNEDKLHSFHFRHFSSRFPNLTSLNGGICSDTFIIEMAQIKTLTELTFVTDGTTQYGVRTGPRGWEAIGSMKRLKFLRFWAEESHDIHIPNSSCLHHVYRLTELSRLCINANWFHKSFFQFVYPQLRCLELLMDASGGYYFCSIEDDDLYQFIKPKSHQLYAEQVDNDNDEDDNGDDDNDDDDYDGNDDEDDDDSDDDSDASDHEEVSDDFALVHFPVLQCLDLPYDTFDLRREGGGRTRCRGCCADVGYISEWTINQLCASYQYVSTKEWQRCEKRHY